MRYRPPHRAVFPSVLHEWNLVTPGGPYPEVQFLEDPMEAILVGGSTEDPRRTGLLSADMNPNLP